MGPDFASFWINLFTLALANSTVFTVKGDLVKMGECRGRHAGGHIDMAATPWRHVVDTWALYNPSTITPLFVVVDADGRIRGIEPGARALAYLAAELRALIDESGTLPSSRH